MKIILKDFTYKGTHYENFELELPDHIDIGEVSRKKISGYLFECLDLFIEKEESGLKTIEELYNEGLMSIRLRNALYRGVYYSDKAKNFKNTDFSKWTVKKLHNTFGEEIKDWRMMGKVTYEEFKSLL